MGRVLVTLDICFLLRLKHLVDTGARTREFRAITIW